MLKYRYISVLVFGLMLLPLTLACSTDDETVSTSSEYSALFRTTDKFVNSLSYYGSGGSDSETTSDYKYKVTLLGRLIIVKKNTSSGPSYTSLSSALEKHYKSNSKVKDVFINQGGTVTIDCRN